MLRNSVYAAAFVAGCAAMAPRPAADGTISSVSSMIADYATESTTPQEAVQAAAAEPGTHLSRVTGAVMRATVLFATEAVDWAPTDYWLAVGMVAIVVAVFLLCWCEQSHLPYIITFTPLPPFCRALASRGTGREPTPAVAND